MKNLPKGQSDKFVKDGIKTGIVTKKDRRTNEIPKGSAKMQANKSYYKGN